MKKNVLAVIFVISTFVLTTESYAWFGLGKKAEEKKAAPEAAAQKEQPKAQQTQAAKPAQPVVDKAAMEAAKQRRLMADRKRQELNNTQWQIELTGKSKKEKDSVVFKENKVSFPSFGKKGFPPTNYTVVVQANGSVVWETMQTAEKGAVAFWRGEIEPTSQQMRGVLNYNPDGKSYMEYSFLSTAKGPVQEEEKKE